MLVYNKTRCFVSCDNSTIKYFLGDIITLSPLKKLNYFVNGLAYDYIHGIVYIEDYAYSVMITYKYKLSEEVLPLTKKTI